VNKVTGVQIQRFSDLEFVAHSFDVCVSQTQLPLDHGQVTDSECVHSSVVNNG
jgi:hypothetical protein